MENTLLVKDVLYLMGGLTSIIAFIVLITKPYNNLKSKIEDQDNIINNKLNNQENSIKSMQETLTKQQNLLNSSLKVQLLLMQHLVFGNHTDALKKKLEDLESVIVDQ